MQCGNKKSMFHCTLGSSSQDSVMIIGYFILFSSFALQPLNCGNTDANPDTDTVQPAGE